MSLKFIVFHFLLLLYNSDGVPMEVHCPGYCICDEFEGMRRATCQNKKLVTVEIGMPSMAEILDLSHNMISKLDNHIFLEIDLTHLKLLNLSDNKIAHIALSGFEGLNGLKTLDLSYNTLSYFMDQWFVSLGQLQELYLRGNQLRSISHEPKLNLPNLKVLDVSNSGIVDLRQDVFDRLPNLEVLDISENDLIFVDAEMIKSLPKLAVFKMKKTNHLTCNQQSTLQLMHFAKKHNITLESSCKTKNKNKGEKFQRMMIGSEEPKKNSWIYDEQKEKEAITTVIEINTCNGTNSTFNNYSGGIFTFYLLEIISLSPWLFVCFILTFGITVGIAIGCSCQIRGKKRDNTNRGTEHLFLTLPYRDSIRNLSRRDIQRQNSAPSAFRSRTRSTGSRKFLREDRNILLMNESKLSDSTPVLARKSLYSNV